MGKTGESVNTTHQTKKLDVDDLMYYRDRFDVPLTDEQVKNIEYFRPDEKSQEIKYLKAVKRLENCQWSRSLMKISFLNKLVQHCNGKDYQKIK